MLNRIIDVWKKTDFRLVKDHTKDTYIITATDEIQILLEGFICLKLKSSFKKIVI